MVKTLFFGFPRVGGPIQDFKDLKIFIMSQRNRINEFIELISNIMESYTTILFLPDEKEEDILRIKAFYSLGKNIKEDCLVRRGEGFVGWVFREQKPVLVSHFDKRDAAILKFYNREEKIKSLLISPLPHKAGAIYVDSKKSYIFTEEKEKILDQIGKIIVSMLVDENEIKEKRRTEKYLDFSLKFLEIIAISKNRNDLVEKTLLYLSIFFEIQYIVFFNFGEKIYILNKLDNENLIKKENFSFFDEYGFCGWIIKNNKELLLENIKKNDTSYILNKNEKIENINNFFGIPLSFYENKGLISFIKKNKEKWNAREIKILYKIGSLFYREYMQKNESF